MPKTIRGQIVASTRMDLQGEEIPREILEDLVAAYPKRMPLHQRHDLSLRTVGYIENFRVDEDSNHDGQFVIRADITISAGQVAPDLRGFSISFTQGIASNSPTPLQQIYLPYPLYKDPELIRFFLEDSPSVLVGKFVKKQFDPEAIGLIVAGVAFLLAPEWDIQYKKHVRPALLKLITWLAVLRERNASVDFAQDVFDAHGEKVQLVFIPERGDEETWFAPERIEDGIRLCQYFLGADESAQSTGVRRVKLICDSSRSAYSILHVEYRDGTDCHFA